MQTLGNTHSAGWSKSQDLLGTAGHGGRETSWNSAKSTQENPLSAAVFVG